jgi:hypothetical protein
MGGSTTGGLNTQRISASNGYRTLGSMIANGGSGAGAGSTRRVLSWYARNGITVGNGFYREIFNLNYGQFRSRAQWFVQNVV